MENWQRAKESLRERVGDGNFDRWIKPLQIAEVRDGRVFINAPNKFYLDWVSKNFLSALRESFATTSDPAPEIVLRISDPRQRELFGADAAGEEKPAPRRGAPRVGNLIPHYTFENFVVGPSNQFAHAAALAVASRPGEHYNPFFVYGWVGVGKTHLVNAIGHAVLKKNPLAKIVYVASESFVNDMIAALRRDRMDEFKNRFRKVDLLIIDDVQFLAGRERTQEEFFHTFNSLHEERRQIILTSDKFPKDIPDLEERLRNRFEWGLTADIQAPEMETRCAIIQQKAELVGVKISPEVANFVASEISTNVRELEGAITRLSALASLQNVEVTVPFAEAVLQPHLTVRRNEVTVEEVQRLVCEHFGISLTEMKSKRRTQHVATSRQIAMFLARRVVGASFPAIGDKFGGRDHSTAIHAHTVVGKRIENDPTLRATVDGLERRLTKKTS